MHIEQSQFQDQLVRGLAHRMNNILTLFQGYVSLMLENEKLDPVTREQLGKIKQGADAASELMDRTHSLVRPSALVWREIHLAEFIGMMKGSFESICSKSTRIEFICPDELPPVLADANRVKTAIVEIVRNACESAASNSEGGHVTIQVAEESGSGKAQPRLSSAVQKLKWVTISVTDNGPGIPPEASEKVFQPFFTNFNRPGAAGLGLTVAASVVQQLGGFIRHESEPGRTTFQIVLPARNDIARVE